MNTAHPVETNTNTVTVSPKEAAYEPQTPQQTPSRIARASTLRILAITSLVSQILIVVTGGAVRLTKSGLGCDSWPNCTPENMFPVPEAGVHGFIEFGNRLLTPVLLTIAILMLVSTWKSGRRDILWLSWSLFLGIPGQAILGLVTVLTKLNPWVVGSHFVLSMLLIGLATVQLNRVLGVAGKQLQDRYMNVPTMVTRPRLFHVLSSVMLGATTLVITLGIVVTGSGPHAGDENTPRNGLDSDIWTRLHSIPAYALVFVTLILLFLACWPRTYVAKRRLFVAYLRTPILLLLAAELTQAVIGYLQHSMGLPVPLVLLHLLGAAGLMSLSINITQRTYMLR